MVLEGNPTIKLDFFRPIKIYAVTIYDVNKFM